MNQTVPVMTNGVISLVSSVAKAVVELAGASKAEPRLVALANESLAAALPVAAVVMPRVKGPGGASGWFARTRR